MLPEGLEECLREGLVVAAGVAAVGVDLREGLLVVDVHEVAVLGQRLLRGVVAVDELAGVVGIGLVVDDGLEGQAVGWRGLLGGPAEGDGGYGEDETGQPQHVDDGLGAVDGGAEKAEAEAAGFGKVAEGLAVEQGVGGGVEEGEEVVVARVGLPLLCPARGAPEVGAEGEHDGRRGDHRLAEVGGGEPTLLIVGTGDDNAVELQVAHGLGAQRGGEQAVEQLVGDGGLGVLADGAPHF